MRNRKPHTIIGLLLALSLLFGCIAAADGTFLFRNGIIWDTTVAQMMAAEGLTEGDGTYNRQPYNGYTFFYLGNRDGGVDVSYVYRGNEPVMVYAVRSGDAYAAKYERLAGMYGAPADVSADTVSMLQNQLLPGRTIPGDFFYLVAWRLDDGTLAALFIIDGECFEAYFHERRILGGA